MESKKPCLVLVVEDTTLIEKSVEDILQRRGYVNASFQDPYRALEYLSINLDRVDLIITDTETPGIGGIEMAKRAVAMSPHVSVILLYGQGKQQPQIATLPNIRFMIEKPASEKDLVEAVESVIKECGLLPERRRYR